MVKTATTKSVNTKELAELSLQEILSEGGQFLWTDKQLKVHNSTLSGTLTPCSL